MAGRIDMDHVAVIGHSYGGYVALAMAGAQYDLGAFNARCAQLPAGDRALPYARLSCPRKQTWLPELGWIPCLKAFGPHSVIPADGHYPDGRRLVSVRQGGLAKITIPMMAIGGTADTGTPYEWGSKPSYDNASSAKKALVTLEGAEHTITTSCKNLPWMSKTPFGPWICTDPAWDKNRGQDLINHFSTVFLLDTLKGDAAAASAGTGERDIPGDQVRVGGLWRGSSSQVKRHFRGQI